MKKIGVVVIVIMILILITKLFPTDLEEHSSVDDQIAKENGVVVYRRSMRISNGNYYLLIDTNDNYVYSFTDKPGDYDKYRCSGKLTDAGITYRDDVGDVTLTLVNGGLNTIHYHREWGTSSQDNNYNKTDYEEASALLSGKINWNNDYEDRFENTATIGHYEQNAVLTDGKEPIVWDVLCTNGGKSLVLTTYIIEFKYFLEVEGVQYIGCSWDDSTIAEWLNGDFYNNAFSQEEKDKILSTKISDNDIISENKIFLLSANDIETYFTSKGKSPAACATASAVKNIPSKYSFSVKEGRMEAWWLRDSGKEEIKKLYVNDEGKIEDDNTDEVNGIRVAMWVDNSLINK